MSNSAPTNLKVGKEGSANRVSVMKKHIDPKSVVELVTNHVHFVLFKGCCDRKMATE